MKCANCGAEIEVCDQCGKVLCGDTVICFQGFWEARFKECLHFCDEDCLAEYLLEEHAIYDIVDIKEND